MEINIPASSFSDFSFCSTLSMTTQNLSESQDTFVNCKFSPPVNHCCVLIYKPASNFKYSWTNISTVRSLHVPHMWNKAFPIRECQFFLLSDRRLSVLMCIALFQQCYVIGILSESCLIFPWKFLSAIFPIIVIYKTFVCFCVTRETCSHVGNLFFWAGTHFNHLHFQFDFRGKHFTSLMIRI